MRGRNIALASIAVLFLIALAGVWFGWLEPHPPLTIHVRCHDSVGGTLFISTLSASGTPETEQSADVRSACAAGRVELQRYAAEASLRIKITRDDGFTGEISALYGPNIQRDHDGFFTVIRITNIPPFLANDSI